MHDKLFETYFSWMTHVGLPARTPAEDEVPTQAEDKVTIGSYTYGASEFDAAIAQHRRERNEATQRRPDAGKQWACNAQLHRCLLFLLLSCWASNLNNTPSSISPIHHPHGAVLALVGRAT